VPDDASNTLSAHAVEEFFLNDFPVFYGIQTRFVEVHPLACHWTRCGGDVVLEANDAAVSMRPWTFHFALVHSVVFFKPLALRFYGGDPFLASGAGWASLWFDADDLRTVERIDRFRFFAFATQLDQLLSYSNAPLMFVPFANDVNNAMR
jgi:hypothetical protein